GSSGRPLDPTDQVGSSGRAVRHSGVEHIPHWVVVVERKYSRSPRGCSASGAAENLSRRPFGWPFWRHTHPGITATARLLGRNFSGCPGIRPRLSPVSRSSDAQTQAIRAAPAPPAPAAPDEGTVDGFYHWIADGQTWQ